MPETEALQPRFRAANTQVLGISVDSVFCHANWAVSLGGISFPLLSDFAPKGAAAGGFGLYLEDAGITDRATVILDKEGTVRHISSVGPSGRRNIEDLAALCEGIHDGNGTVAEPNPFPASTLYVKTGCGFSLRALNARVNLHLEERIAVKNVTEDAAAKAEMMKAGGKDQAPCLVTDGNAMYESDDITRHMAQTIYPL